MGAILFRHVDIGDRWKRDSTSWVIGCMRCDGLSALCAGASAHKNMRAVLHKKTSKAPQKRKEDEKARAEGFEVLCGDCGEIEVKRKGNWSRPNKVWYTFLSLFM